MGAKKKRQIMNNRNLVLFASESLRCLNIYPADFTEAQLLEIGIMLESRHTIYSNQSDQEQSEFDNSKNVSLFVSVTDDEILTSACAFGLKNQVKNHQAIIKMVRSIIKTIIKRNQYETQA